jgi:hypothetical protein
VLAYYFALAHTGEDFSNGLLPPISVDSPHQKAQDEIRKPLVTEFIVKNRPSEQQLILGLEDPPPTTIELGPDDLRIDLTEQYGLLTAEDYQEVFNFIDPMWRAVEMAVTASKRALVELQ